MSGSTLAPTIVVGRVRKPHGLKGELAVYPLTDSPSLLFTVGREFMVLNLGGEKVGLVTLETTRSFHREWLLRFKGYSDRDAVEDFRQHFLALPREVLPPLGEGEVYERELVGFAVRDEQGAPLGIVSEVYELPTGVAIEVQGPKREFLLPFLAEYVKETDRDGRWLVVAVPDGLIG
jgi:16S rRNA processing protein RimM